MIGVFAAADLRAEPSVPSGSDLLCPLVEHERKRALEDSRFELDLVTNEFRAREKVFAMVEKLWQTRSIEQEAYLDYKRLRDRTRLRMARLSTQISQDESIAEQYSLTCAAARGQTVDRLQEKVEASRAEYRRLECELLARDAEIAAVDYEFDRAVLEATRELVARNTKSKYELVIEEYDLSQSKANFDSYRARTAACKQGLAD